MPRLCLDETLLTSAAFAEFCRTMEYDRPTGLGMLVLLQYHSRQIHFAVGRQEDLYAHLPGPETKKPLLMRALVRLGAVATAGPGEVEVLGNQAFFARIEGLRAAGRKGRSTQDLVPKRDKSLRDIEGRAHAEQERSPAVRAAPVSNETALQKACRATWEAYRSAFFEHHGVDPQRNALVNTQVKTLVQRMGHDEAPDLVRFYVEHPDPYYASRGHDLGILVRQYQGLSTEWRKGEPLLPGHLRDASRHAHAADQMRRIRAGDL